MKTEFEASLDRMGWFGAKAKIADLLSVKPINFLFRHVAASFFSPVTASRFPVSVSRVVYRLDGGGEVALLDPVRDEVARGVYWGGGRLIDGGDQCALSCIEWLCRDARTFIDIGAYAGLYALVAAKSEPQLNAVTFEIVPENHLLVMRNIVENDMVRRIDARLCGLSDQVGAITVAPSLRLDRLASSITIESDFRTGVSIPVTTLDEAIGDCAGPVVLKIDVEGFEAAVLRGGRDLFERHRPDFICEILPRSRDFKEVELMLRSLDYRFYQIDNDGLRRHADIDPTRGGRDWLFTVRDDVPPDLLAKNNAQTG